MTNRYATMTPAEFLDAMDDVIGKHAMLSHPFYQRWSEGGLSRDDLADYVAQYYNHVKAFPAYVSAVHSRCDDIPTRQMLLENLIEEEHGPDNHPELWLRFADALGLERGDVSKAAVQRTTAESVAQFREITQRADFREGLAALYAYESQIPAVSQTKREGLAKFYGIDDARGVSFFTVHEVADIIHREVERKVLAQECVTGEDREKVINAAKEASKALWHFLDGMNALCMAKAAA